MHGLINRAIQRFVTDNYGSQKWDATMARAGFDFTDFEPMWTYEREMTQDILASVVEVLDRSYEDVLEDIGTYLVSHPKLSALRRLLRFGGLDFVDFLHSLDDLPDRARLAVDDLELPRIELIESEASRFCLRCHSKTLGWGHVFVGLLRAMADDYGALIFLEHRGMVDKIEIIEITLLDVEHSEGREFALGAHPV